MFGRSRFLSFPMVIGAVIIGVVSGKAIFGPPLDEYWKKKLEEEATAKKTGTSSSQHRLRHRRRSNFILAQACMQKKSLPSFRCKRSLVFDNLPDRKDS
ncbi:uncharacterized protein LOC111017867 [Momordica charantia]|uniref:Uncharacterized protein LOC111017867 n=1 Tax=Momordica charantia TaxID=3673 RepID=A0A6J1D6S8_MOMCH|nr:uncharacterized protein LOC111017867 [Momordica charantia]